MDDEIRFEWEDEQDTTDDSNHRNLQTPVYRLKHGMGFFGVVGGTGCYSTVSGGQAQGNFQVNGATLNIFVPYLRGFSSSVI